MKKNKIILESAKQIIINADGFSIDENGLWVFDDGVRIARFPSNTAVIVDYENIELNPNRLRAENSVVKVIINNMAYHIESISFSVDSKGVWLYSIFEKVVAYFPLSASVIENPTVYEEISKPRGGVRVIN